MALNRSYWCGKTASVTLVTAITILAQLTNTVSYRAWVSATNLTSCYQLHFLSRVIVSLQLMWNAVLEISVRMAYNTIINGTRKFTYFFIYISWIYFCQSVKRVRLARSKEMGLETSALWTLPNLSPWTYFIDLESNCSL